ncbi:MAG: pyridoxine 5'-phosphate synthase [Zavarzinella sp.]
MIRLGVNVDHIATIRQARRAAEPDPVVAASLAMLGGANGITIHLREDRRHIQDRDLLVMRQVIPTGLNLEMGCTDEMLGIAVQHRPDQVTLVPEKRQELTTEGGLDVIGQRAAVLAGTKQLMDAGIPVALFINPDPAQVLASKEVGAIAVEFHTGQYADATTPQAEWEKLHAAAVLAHELGLHVHMGHGLNYLNVQKIVRIPYVEELNIGHSLIARASLVGMVQAVKDMKAAMMEHYPHKI